MDYRRPGGIPRHVASGRERLERLAAFVERLPSSRLSFASWRSCAVGLAADEPWFRAQGLGLEHDGRVDDCRPVFAGRTDWIAVATFFDIGVGEARALLDPSGYDGEIRPEPTAVARTIRRHLEATKTVEQSSIAVAAHV